MNKDNSPKNLLLSIISDKNRYGKYWIKHPGFWVVLSYRIRKPRKTSISSFFLLVILDLIIGIIRSIISDTKIPSNVDAGNGLFLPHPNGIIINYSAKIGKNVAIFQQVTIGEWKNGTPKIGDSTSIYAGAKIFGEINIGANCRIGPNFPWVNPRLCRGTPTV